MSSYVDNQDGTFTVTVTGLTSGTQSVKLQNTSVTSGGVINLNTGGASSVSATFSGPQIGTTSVIAITLYTGANQTGGTSSGGTVNATCSVRAPSITATSSGVYSGCNWSAAAMDNGQYAFSSITITRTINGGSPLTFRNEPASGSFPSNQDYVGYGNTVTWTVTATYTSATFGTSYTTPSSSSSITMPEPPPSPPNPPTNLHVTLDTGTSVALAWTASSGGASGYEVQRSINGAAFTSLGTLTGTTYTDNSPGAVRPIVYQVRAYNSNSSGSAYSGFVSVTDGAVDSVGILTG